MALEFLDATGLGYFFNKIKTIFAPKERAIYPVVGRIDYQTGNWGGNIDVDELFDGLTIAYYIPSDHTGTASLMLTLSGGEQTEAVPVYYTGQIRMDDQYFAGSTLLLTYWSAGSVSINGTLITEGRWTRSDFSVSDASTVNGHSVLSDVPEDLSATIESLRIRIWGLEHASDEDKILIISENSTEDNFVLAIADSQQDSLLLRPENEA